MPRDIPEIAVTHTIALRAYRLGGAFRDFTIRPPIGLRRQFERLTETLRPLRESLLAFRELGGHRRLVWNPCRIVRISYYRAPHFRHRMTAGQPILLPTGSLTAVAYPDCGR